MIKSYLHNSQDAVHGGLSGLSTDWVQVAIKPRKVKGYEAGHRQPQQQHVAGFPNLWKVRGNDVQQSYQAIPQAIVLHILILNALNRR